MRKHTPWILLVLVLVSAGALLAQSTGGTGATTALAGTAVPDPTPVQTATGGIRELIFTGLSIFVLPLIKKAFKQAADWIDDLAAARGLKKQVWVRQQLTSLGATVAMEVNEWARNELKERNVGRGAAEMVVTSREKLDKGLELMEKYTSIAGVDRDDLKGGLHRGVAIVRSKVEDRYPIVKPLVAGVERVVQG